MQTQALQAQRREIGGCEWTVTPLTATRGLDVGRRLLRLLGPGFARLMAGAPGKLLDADAGSLGDAAGALFERLGDPDAAALVKELTTSGVLCDGKEVSDATFDLVFAGNYGTLLRVAGFVIQVNFAVPLDSWLSRVALRAATPTEPHEPAQPTSQRADKSARTPRATSTSGSAGTSGAR